MDFTQEMEVFNMTFDKRLAKTERNVLSNSMQYNSIPGIKSSCATLCHQVTHHVEEDGAVQGGQQHPKVQEGKQREEHAGRRLLRVQGRLQPVRPPPLPRRAAH